MPRHTPDDPDRKLLAESGRALLAWYDRNRRELPWRGTKDAWAILVSEVMLQQTTVVAARPYWERFMARWPTPHDLARAERDELLAEWAGLGYYRRAHLLMDTALAVAESHDGALPRTSEKLRELRGVGDYTAAAVASIAHDEPVAAVDGNVERVVSRWRAIGGDPKKSVAKKAIRAAADAWLSQTRPGDHNQAVMELGATICKPRSPDCPRCPLAPSCRARAAGEPQRYPETPPRAKPTPVTKVGILARRPDGRVLLERRSESPNAGFLELPQRVVETTAMPPTAAQISDACNEVASAAGLALTPGVTLTAHKHSITRYRITVWPIETAASTRRRPVAPFAWCRIDDVDQPLTTASKRILTKNAPSLFAS